MATILKRDRYYDFVMAAFVGILLLSNLIGAAKIANLGGYAFGAGVLFFPISYVLGDVLTEVYGYAKARRCVWAGFVALGFMSIMSLVVVGLPADPSWHDQPAYEAVFGQTPRIVIASMLAFLAGELVNAYVLARMKVWTNGRHLWSRTIGSTIIGQGVDSLVFYPIAFLAVWDSSALVSVMWHNFVLKVGWEALLTPVTYRVVATLKKAEGEDHFDTDTDFTPFSTRIGDQ